MFAQTHRPVPLPRQLATVTIPAPPGSRLSKVIVGDNGQPYTVNPPQPVDSEDRRTAHILHVCPQYFEVGDDEGESCGSARWLLPDERVPHCEAHGDQLMSTSGPHGTAGSILPWGSMYLAVRPKLPPVMVLAAEAAAGIALHHTTISPILVAALAPPVLAASAHVAVKRHLRKQKIDNKKIDPEQEEGRRIETIARRARTAAYMAIAGGGWLSAAALTDPNTLAGRIVWSALIPGWALGAATYWRHVDRIAASHEVPEEAPEVLEVKEPEPEVDMLPTRIIQQWARRVGQPSGVLAGTTLVDVKPLPGHGTNWRGVIESEPGKWDLSNLPPQTNGRIAGAFRADASDVTIDAYPGDASRAHIMIQPDNPLCRVQHWAGPEANAFLTGLSLLGRYSDAADAEYVWFNDGGPWHDLICGCTGSGKSELVAMLIASELNSDGLCLSWVADPCKGQSYGDLQDCVDWFSRDLNETRFMLLAAVKEMLRRNNLFSQRRIKTWYPSLEFPLLVLTLDEAHEILKDPICQELVERLANMARKVGIKLRIITQVPMLTQLGGSTPIKDALVAGQLIILRIGSAVSAQVAVGGAAEIAPHRLPKLWPAHSEAAGQTTAGIGFLLGAASRNARLRTVWPGKEVMVWLRNNQTPEVVAEILKDPRVTKKDRDADDIAWLRAQLGDLTITPGAFSADAQQNSGPLWGGRQARAEALLNAPIDDATLLRNGGALELIEAANAFAQSGDVSILKRTYAVTPPEAGPAPEKPAAKNDGSRAEDLVLNVIAHHVGDDGRITRETIDREIAKTAKPPASRTIREALLKLTRNAYICVGGDMPPQTYALKPEGRIHAQALAAAVVDQALQGDPELINA